jgi:hypothetical protein
MDGIGGWTAPNHHYAFSGVYPHQPQRLYTSSSSIYSAKHKHYTFYVSPLGGRHLFVTDPPRPPSETWRGGRGLAIFYLT